MVATRRSSTVAATASKAEPMVRLSLFHLHARFQRPTLGLGTPGDSTTTDVLVRS